MPGHEAQNGADNRRHRSSTPTSDRARSRPPPAARTPTAMVVTREAHSKPTASSGPRLGLFNHARLPLPRRRRQALQAPVTPGPQGQVTKEARISLARSENFEAEGGQSAISYTGHNPHVNHSAPNSRNFSQSRPRRRIERRFDDREICDRLRGLIATVCDCPISNAKLGKSTIDRPRFDMVSDNQRFQEASAKSPETTLLDSSGSTQSGDSSCMHDLRAESVPARDSKAASIRLVRA